MAKYLVLYRSNVSAMEQMQAGTPEERQAAMDAWMKWGQRAGPALSDWVSPLGEATALGEGMQPTPGYIGGYSILEADSLTAAKALVENHPHLTTPGGASVELHELLPMPGSDAVA